MNMKTQVTVVGLLILFVLAPIVEVFSASLDPRLGPFLTPEEREELGVQQPSVVAEFPFAPNGAEGLTFILRLANRATTDVPIQLTTVPSNQTPITQQFTLGAAQIVSVTPQTAACPSGATCRLLVIHPAGPNPVFDALMQIVSTTGTPVGLYNPTFFYVTE